MTLALDHIVSKKLVMLNREWSGMENGRTRAQQVDGSHTVNFAGNSKRRVENTPLTSMVVLNQVSLKVTLDTAVHPS